MLSCMGVHGMPWTHASGPRGAGCLYDLGTGTRPDLAHHHRPRGVHGRPCREHAQAADGSARGPELEELAVRVQAGQVRPRGRAAPGPVQPLGSKRPPICSQVSLLTITKPCPLQAFWLLQPWPEALQLLLPLQAFTP